jgi:leucyl/phenylalanyl-tRNA--protein transferase
MTLYLLDPDDPKAPFPPVDQAETDPDGLLALGGDLSLTRLLTAYKSGIFPWYSQGQPIMWWSPDPRTVLFPEEIHISRSLRKAMRKSGYSHSFDHAFAQVIEACAEPRRDQPGTWITPEMKRAYIMLHNQGHAHSVEIWDQNRLIGGLYGVLLGRVFFGESMFSRASNSSKMALVHLAQTFGRGGGVMIDCQVYTDHLSSLGAEEIDRDHFVELLQQHTSGPPVQLRPPQDDLESP